MCEREAKREKERERERERERDKAGHETKANVRQGQGRKERAQGDG